MANSATPSCEVVRPSPSLHGRDARRPRPDHHAVGEEHEGQRDACFAHQTSTTSTPAARKRVELLGRGIPLRDDVRQLLERRDHVRAGRAELVRSGHSDDLGGVRDHGPLHVRLLDVEHRDSDLGMQAADAEDEDVRPHRSERLDGRGTDECLCVLGERPADDGHLDARVIREHGCDRRAVRHDRRLEIDRQVAGDLEGRRAGVEQDHLPGTEQATSGASDGGLRGGCLLQSLDVWTVRRPQAAAPRRAPAAGGFASASSRRSRRTVSGDTSSALLSSAARPRS